MNLIHPSYNCTINVCVALPDIDGVHYTRCGAAFALLVLPRVCRLQTIPGRLRVWRPRRLRREKKKQLSASVFASSAITRTDTSMCHVRSLSTNQIINQREIRKHIVSVSLTEL